MWSVPGQWLDGKDRVSERQKKPETLTVNRFNTIKGVWHPRVLASQAGQDERGRKQDDRIRIRSWIRVIM